MLKFLTNKPAKEIFRLIFSISLALYVLLFILETVSPGFVSFYFNSDIVLWIVLIFGVAYLLIKED